MRFGTDEERLAVLLLLEPQGLSNKMQAELEALQLAKLKREHPVSYTTNVDNQVVCNGTHCGCREKPLGERLPGLIHGYIKAPLGR